MLSRFLLGEEPISSRIAATPSKSLAVTVITVEEMLTGWQRLLRVGKTDRQMSAAYAAMASTIELLTNLTILRYSEAAIARYRHLASQKPNVSGNDLRIAAIALENGATVVTRNVRDFNRIPGLAVENWCD